MKNQNIKKAFTMIELIFAIVIIGILSSVAIPKFRGMTSNAKISAEMAVASSVKTALESINGEWSINESSFKWGVNHQYTQDDLDSNGYPHDLNSTAVLGKVVKNANSFIWHSSGSDNNLSIYTGPASNPDTGVGSSKDTANKPDSNDFWAYTHDMNGSCTIGSKTLYDGDFTLIDINGSNSTTYSDIKCN